MATWKFVLLLLMEICFFLDAIKPAAAAPYTDKVNLTALGLFLGGLTLIIS